MAVESGAPEGGAPGEADEASGVRIWFRALLRSLVAIVVTLAVLAAVGFTADVILHRVVHTSHTGESYAGISTVEIVLDGDGAVSVSGLPRNGSNSVPPVSLTETDSSTMFDHPQRTVDRIGGTLYIAVHCPDSLCSADLGVSVPAATPVTLRVGNALRLDRATVTINGMSGPISLTAWPAKVSVSNSTSTVTGDVTGSVSCSAPAVCIVQLVG